MLHGIPLKEHHVKVTVRKIYDGYKLFPLPVPTEETYTLGNALYGFTQWPRSSIALVKVKYKFPLFFNIIVICNEINM